MNARDMFKKIGYELTLSDDDMMIYNQKTDYVDNSVFFHLGKNYPKSYDIWFVDWWDIKGDDWIPMSERETEWLKHCARYGHWQKVERAVGVDLHKAIHQQIKELGWLNDR